MGSNPTLSAIHPKNISNPERLSVYAAKAARFAMRLHKTSSPSPAGALMLAPLLSMPSAIFSLPA
ncbi:hypothetical protein D5366_01540 [Neokomagataea tanensis]|uniref:Uncharacterized protein n=1 Tax=Neokomagataea tanensis TaxID=661191 RepID=A0A4Y6V2A3_9PROT|nr:hypothetical protein D5366_01540 [Neokomagataea tanensis]